MPILLEFPLSVVQQTHLPCFEPARDAVEVESMVTDAPCHGALFRSSGPLVGLAFYAKIHNVVPADGTVINHSIPGPEGYCIPLQRENREQCTPLLVTRTHKQHINHTHTLGFHAALIIFSATRTTKQKSCWIVHYSHLLFQRARATLCTPILPTVE